MEIKGSQEWSFLWSVTWGRVHQGVELGQKEMCEALRLLCPNLWRNLRHDDRFKTTYLFFSPCTHFKEQHN